MRPGQEAPDNLEEAVALRAVQSASMRPGQEAPDNPRNWFQPTQSAK